MKFLTGFALGVTYVSICMGMIFLMSWRPEIGIPVAILLIGCLVGWVHTLRP